MHPEPIQRLIEFFMRLPGIGPRQASRFASTLLDEDSETLEAFGENLKRVAKEVTRCEDCFRSTKKNGDQSLCSRCSGTIHAILVVEKDQDLETIEKSGIWHDAYHELGGTISLLNEKSRVTERIKALYDRVAKRTKENNLEIVLATSATTEGDATCLYIERVLEPFLKTKQVKITRLGRGISRGSELEFTDPETLKSALENRRSAR